METGINVRLQNCDAHTHQKEIHADNVPASFPRPLVGSWNQTSNATNLTSYSLDTTSNINFTLPAWTGKPKSLGFTIDAQYTRSVFYIGSDRKLYQVSSIHYVWQMRSNQTDAQWPLADDAEADMAVASDFSSSAVRVYYVVKGVLTEAKFEAQGSSGVWRSAAALPTAATAATANTPPSTSAAEPAPAGSGLSDGAKAGVGVGVTLGVLALAGIGVVVFVVRRGRARRDAEAHAAAEEARALDTQQYQPSHYDYTHTPYGSPPPTSVSPFSAPGWPADKKDGYAPQELGAPRQVFEMPEQQYSHELLGEGHVREMQ